MHSAVNFAYSQMCNKGHNVSVRIREGLIYTSDKAGAKILKCYVRKVWKEKIEENMTIQNVDKIKNSKAI